ncbi:30S ribosomal protein S18 [Candidatus Peregrinibacteria bacterium]|nr:30S ribosomal protein S18 [Candidatus Peregrinibacteria bacterium]
MSKFVFSTNQKHQLGKRRCAFCTNQVADIDYKDVKTLRIFINGFRKIKNRYYSGVCLQHQKKLSKSIKRARHICLLPFTN